MNDFQRKIQGISKKRGLSISLKGIPKRICPERLEQLVIRLRQGNREVEKEIIEGHMRLGIFIVSKYAFEYESKVDDLLGEMFLAITEGVRRCSEGRLYDNNITPYLTTIIHSRLGVFIAQDRAVYIPESTVRYFAKNGDPRLERPPVQVGLATFDRSSEKLDDSNQFVQISVAENNYSITPQVHDESLLEITEIIDKVTENFIEKRVIELRSEGYTYEEIGPQVGYAKSKIGLIVSSIEERFNKYYG